MLGGDCESVNSSVRVSLSGCRPPEERGGSVLTGPEGQHFALAGKRVGGADVALCLEPVASRCEVSPAGIRGRDSGRGSPDAVGRLRSPA